MASIVKEVREEFEANDGWHCKPKCVQLREYKGPKALSSSEALFPFLLR